MASSVNFSGTGSGIDFAAVRDAIIAQRSVPINRMQSKVSTFNSRVDALKKLNALLATFTNATKDLTSRTVGTGRTATVGDDSVVSVTASNSSTLGNMRLDVNRLASNLTQASRSYGSAADPVLAGGAATATFQINKGGSDTGFSVTVDSSNNTLAGFRDAINAAGAGVTASIIDVNGDGTGQQLVLSSNTSGASGRVELVETTSTGTAADLAIRNLNPIDGDFSKLDALLSINGLAITRSTNDISDAVAGLSIKLKKVGSTSIDVSGSTDIKDKLTSLVTAYNAVQDFVSAQYTKDAQGRPTGLLAGDSTLRNAQQQIGTITDIESLANGGSLTSLAQIGIGLSKDGKMTLDETVLNQQLQRNAGDVAALLNGKTSNDTGIFQSAYSVANALSDNITGSVQNAITGYQSSVKSLNNTILDRQAIMDRLKDSLTRQFAIADAAIGQLNSQGASLSSTLSALTNRNS